MKLVSLGKNHQEDIRQVLLCIRLKMPLFSRNSNENVESVEESSKAVIQRLFGDVSKASVAKQLAVGCVTGWCSGYLFVKVGKTASMAVGGGLIILQVAHHQGWINVHWGNVDKTVKKAKNKITKQNVPELLEKLEIFVRQNIFLSSGFAGGFFIGLAC